MSKTSTLAHWVGVRKGTAQKATSDLTTLHREASRPAQYNGFTKVFAPKAEDGEVYPPESKLVVQDAVSILHELQRVSSSWWDVIATCERGNMAASADLVVDGLVLAKDLPVPCLLFLDKRFKDIRTFIQKMPTLDANVEWHLDPNTGTYRSDPQKTHRTKKVQKALTLVATTPEHAGQAQLITEDEVVGWWTTVQRSGALPVPLKKGLLARVEALLKAVSFAVTEANRQPVATVDVAEPLFTFLFAGLPLR